MKQFRNVADMGAQGDYRWEDQLKENVAPIDVGDLIVAPCIFVESLQFINQRMHI